MTIKRDKILCLDLGSNVGWAKVCEGVVVGYGLQKFKGDIYIDFSSRLRGYYEWLRETLADVKMVYFEEVRFSGSFSSFLQVFGMYVGILFLLCNKYDIGYRGVSVSLIKRKFALSGDAKKEDMIKTANELGYQVTDDNVADAIGVAYASGEVIDVRG